MAEPTRHGAACSDALLPLFGERLKAELGEVAVEGERGSDVQALHHREAGRVGVAVPLVAMLGEDGLRSPFVGCADSNHGRAGALENIL